MNKCIFFGTGLIAFFTIFQLTAEKKAFNFMSESINHGSQNYGKETVKEIQANGFVQLDKTKITDHLQVNGHLKAEKAQIREMQINGQATLNHCFIQKKSGVCGTLVATNTKFGDELSISSSKVILDSCSLTSLHILKIGGHSDVQVVELKGKTRIEGAITFESGNGEVIASPDTEIMGSINGGKIRG